MHLTPEQIEQLVESPEIFSPHVAECGACRQKVDDAQAMRARLRQAFASIVAGPEIRKRVRAGIALAGSCSRPRSYAIVRGISSGLAVAAAIAVGILLTAHLAGFQDAYAASTELAQIHQSNLMPHVELHGTSNADKVAEYFKQQLGFVPALPRLGAGMQLRGCCVAYFRNRPVGSYVLDTGRGVVSIIVLRDGVNTLKFAEQVLNSNKSFHTGSFARNKLAAVEINGFTYCAVGETEAEWLIELLQHLLADTSQ